MDEDDGEITFEEQLELEKQASAQKSHQENDRVKVDPDGTVYDWDSEKKAWFPRINEDFLAQYQMNYGSDVSSNDVITKSDVKRNGTSSTDEQAVVFASIPPMPGVEEEGYADWYYKYATVTSTQQYKDWYDYYYGGSRDEQSTELVSDNTSSETTSSTAAAADAATLDPHSEGYWEQLKQQAAEDAEAGISVPEIDEDENDEDEDGKKRGKKKKKARPPPKPAAWFEMQDENNTNVYISGLPPTINMDSFKELTNKCGLIAFDPITRKPKLKLYKDQAGNPKGDGLCCYIKSESVELALKILDGYVLDGHTLSVEKAKFELKGAFDPKKRTKRKLTNKEKKAFREKQAKLFEWRPDKPRFARSRHEKTVIVKNVFSLKDLDDNPLLVNELEQDLTSECAKYGQVKKVRIHERNPEGAVSILFGEAEEADVCKMALNGRWFAARQLLAETWDGKTKYDVQETEEEYQARLRKWEQYLQHGGSKEAAGARPERQTTDQSESSTEDKVKVNANKQDKVAESTKNTTQQKQDIPAASSSSRPEVAIIADDPTGSQCEVEGMQGTENHGIEEEGDISGAASS